MWNCIRQGIEGILPWLLPVAVVMGVLAAIIAGFGGLVIVIAGVAIATVFSAVLAGLMVFGAIVALGVAAVVAGCLLGAAPPSYDEAPAEDPGIQPDDLLGAAVATSPLTGAGDKGGQSGGSDKPRPKHSKGAKRATPGNPPGGAGAKKPA